LVLAVTAGPTKVASVAAPILIITNRGGENPFGDYLGEILRAEGLNAFSITRLDEIDRATLAQADTVLLAEGPVPEPQAHLLRDYVAAGGGLIGMRPDPRLAALFGIAPQPGALAGGLIRVDETRPLARGVAATPLQFHGGAQQYELAGAEVLAWVSDGDAAGRWPGVVMQRYGRGRAVAWAFDLARSVAYTRQGNPAWANQERDGVDGVRAADMFAGWVDPERLTLPQADELQRLLANLLSALSEEKRPLPRLWYFPGRADSMLIATGDAHQTPPSGIETLLTHVERQHGHLSVYYACPSSRGWRRVLRRWRARLLDFPMLARWLPPGLTPPARTVAAWRARGHEFAPHPDVESGIEAGLDQQWACFDDRGYGPEVSTVRTHKILWKGWVETARIQAKRGIRMSLDYYHVGPAFRTSAGDWPHGYFTGSGLPMKFVDEQGRILNIYQQATQLADEQLIPVPWGSQQRLTAEAATHVATELLDRSRNGAYAAVAAQFHADLFADLGEYTETAARWLDATLSHAAAHGIPIWSAEQWLRFTEARHDARLDVIWDPLERRLTVRLTATSDDAADVVVLLPLAHGTARLERIEVDGTAASHRHRRVGGVRYAGVSVRAGTHPIVGVYR
jgi:hypothetical protein